jgi:hypothetical protein
VTFYLIWIPLVIVIYATSAVLTKWANGDESGTWKWVIWLYLLNALGLWPLVAKFSKNLVFDALLYDITIFFSFMLTLMYLDAASKFNVIQWIGTILIVVGFVTLRMGTKL